MNFNQKRSHTMLGTSRGKASYKMLAGLEKPR